MTGSRLAALLDQATPGPWHANTGGSFYAAELRAPSPHNGFALIKVMTNADADLALIALAPDMAQLLVDMADALADRNLIDYEHGKWRTAAIPESVAAALLAAFAALDEKAGGA